MPWSAFSPDLAPIEHVWDELGRRVYSRPNKPTTVDGLRRVLTEEWNNIYSRPNKPTTVDGLRRTLTEEWNNMPQTFIQKHYLVNVSSLHCMYKC